MWNFVYYFQTILKIQIQRFLFQKYKKSTKGSKEWRGDEEQQQKIYGCKKQNKGYNETNWKPDLSKKRLKELYERIKRDTVRGNNRDGEVLQKKSRRKPRPAFISSLEYIFEIQPKTGILKSKPDTGTAETNETYIPTTSSFEIDKADKAKLDELWEKENIMTSNLDNFLTSFFGVRECHQVTWHK